MEMISKEFVIETLWKHYKVNGGFTNTAIKFIREICGKDDVSDLLQKLKLKK